MERRKRMRGERRELGEGAEKTCMRLPLTKEGGARLFAREKSLSSQVGERKDESLFFCPLPLRSSCTHTHVREREGSGERDSGENFLPLTCAWTHEQKEREERSGEGEDGEGDFPPSSIPLRARARGGRWKKRGRKFSPPHACVHMRARRQERGEGSKSLLATEISVAREREKGKERDRERERESDCGRERERERKRKREGEGEVARERERERERTSLSSLFIKEKIF